MRILLLEDNYENSAIVRLILNDAGYDVQAYRSAEAILANQYEIPNLYLLDIQGQG